MNLANREMDLYPPSSLLGKQVIVIAGATSVGKSAVAAQLCKTLNAEIIIADCVQVILKARPHFHDRGIAFMHHLNTHIKLPPVYFTCCDWYI